MATVTTYIPLDPNTIFLNDVYNIRTSYSFQPGVSATFNGVVYDSLYIAYSGQNNEKSQYYYGSNIVIDSFGMITSGDIYGIALYLFDGTTNLLSYSMIFNPIPVATFLSFYNYDNFLSSGSFSGSDSIYGGVGNDVLSGEAGDDYLSGGSGNDTLGLYRDIFYQPVAEPGIDTMVGGLGDDTYYVDGSDIIIENANEGIDTIHSTVSYTLDANLENLVLDNVFPTVFPSNANNFNGTGNSLNNILTGNSGDNILDGGLGADTLIGGSGNDTYIIDGSDTIVEDEFTYGQDTVISSLNYTLANGLENLTLVGTSAINGTGNSGQNIITGNEGDNILNGGGGYDILIGGAGNDTYITTEFYSSITEGVDSGIDTVIVNGSFASYYYYQLSDNVENLVYNGLGVVDLVGNSLNNIITGNGSNNDLYGNGGDDILNGGFGDDIYFIDGGDSINEGLNQGVDTVRASVSYKLTANVENLILGSSNYGYYESTDTIYYDGAQYLDLDGTGNNLNNILRGNDGANRLNGILGIDTLIGGNGDDTYFTDGDDVILENGFSVGPNGVTNDYDRVFASGTYTMAKNLEDLFLTGVAAINGTGNKQDNKINGNSAANTLSGGDGNDTLNGGTGSDILIGGLGDDIFITDGADTISEAADSGIDTVRSSVSYTLGANLDNLMLTGVAAINGSGNSLDNTLIGNAAANILYGGTGTDRLFGGLGNDVYITDGGDTIAEALNAGIDTVRSSASYTLASNLENLVLIGVEEINGTGNILANMIIGNSAANILNGGTGIDRLFGGLGDDIYITDGGDTISEALDAGIDTVRSSASYTLGLNVEDLILTGASAINGTGNALGNVLIGNRGANTLSGGAGDDFLTGGAGKDVLIGGLGEDTFIFNSVSDSSIELATCDVIMDFAVGDKIDLSLMDAFIRSGANDTFIWNGTNAFSNVSSGEVRYQQFDSSGAVDDYTFIYLDNDADSAAEMTIRLTGLHTLTETDFFL